jgi:hypothetical protein
MPNQMRARNLKDNTAECIFGMIAKFHILIFLLLVSAALGSAQSPSDDGRGILPKPDDPNAVVPKNVREMLDKMKVEEEKKDYDEMIDRGGQVLKLSEEIQKSFVDSGTLSGDQRLKLDGIEKLVKKIRGELGGDDSDENESADDLDLPPSGQADAVSKLPKLASRMVDELKKTTRFSISAAAIESSNAVLRMVRFLRGK